MSGYTSRARVLTSLDHKEPDKVPLDFGATRSSGINAIAYNNLLNRLGFESKNFVYDWKQLLSEPDEKVRQMMGGDVVQLHRLTPALGVKLSGGVKRETLTDGSEALAPKSFNYQKEPSGSDVILGLKGEILFRRPKGGLYFDDMYHPLADAQSMEDIEKGFITPTITEEELNYIKTNGKKLFEETFYAVIGSTGMGIFQQGIKDFGFENWLMNIAAEPKLVFYYLEKLTAAFVAVLDKYLDAAGGYIQIIHFADDYGTQDNTIISRETFRTVFMPRHIKINSFIKTKRPALKIMLHCCGAVAPLVPDFIEAGFDILNPVQLTAAGMDPQTLKREYGSRISFWGGGCSSQATLPFKFPSDVRKEAEEMLSIFAPGGGYVFCPDHNIQSGVNPDNIIAFYNTAKEMGMYPIRQS
jgi:uroporphyrinogen decarboxylase